MILTNEIQTDVHYAQDIPEEYLRTLVDLGVIVHVQTTLSDTGVHRYFAKCEDAHPYRVYNLRLEPGLSVQQKNLIAQIIPRDI